jgi:hypothetical protein
MMDINWGDYNQVLESVTENGYALYSASQQLKDNREIVIEAVKENCYALEYAGNLLYDRDIIKKVLKTDPNYFARASLRVRGDFELALFAIRKILIY